MKEFNIDASISSLPCMSLRFSAYRQTDRQTDTSALTRVSHSQQTNKPC